MGADLAENAAPKAVTASGFNKGTKVDTTVGKYNQDGTTVRINLVDERNGVVDGAYTGANTVSAIYVAKVGGSVIAQTGSSLKTGEKPQSHAAIDAVTLQTAYEALAGGTMNTTLDIRVARRYGDANRGAYTSGDKYIEKLLDAGTYRVTYIFSDGKKAEKTFEITDSQAKVTANVKNTTFNGSSISALLGDKDYITFSYGASELLRDNTKLYDGVSVDRANSKHYTDTLVLGKVDVYANLEKFGDSNQTHDVYVKATGVDVNKSFKTTTGGNWTE